MWIRKIPTDSALFRRQLGQWAHRPPGVKLSMDQIYMARNFVFPIPALANLFGVSEKEVYMARNSLGPYSDIV